MPKQAPAGLSPKAKAIWKEVTDSFELRTDELQVLESACRTVDDITRMEKELDGANLIVKGSMGQPADNPLLARLAQYRVTFQRLMGSLKLPEEDEAPKTRSTNARKAAQARWRMSS